MRCKFIGKRQALGVCAVAAMAGTLLFACSTPPAATSGEVNMVGGGTNASSTAGATSASSTAGASNPGGTAASVQNVTMDVFTHDQGIVGPDGKTHDTFVPSGFVVKAGVPVHLSIINHDDGSHSMTFDNPSGAGFGPFIVQPGKDDGNNVDPVTTTFDFTPQAKGNFRWHCALECDGEAGHWAMVHPVASVTVDPSGAVTGGSFSQENGEDGYMAGYVVVL